MPYPEDSTHLKHWIFSQAELQNLRRKVYTNAEDSTRKKFSVLGDTSSRVEFPSFEAVHYLIRYFVAQLIYVCTEKRLDYKVMNTSVVFFIRFYLKRSPLEYDPRRILLTCILLAVKVEECRNICSVAHFCEGLISSRARLKEVVESELLLLDAISFDIHILHARSSIHHHTTEYYQMYKPPKDSPDHHTFNQKITELNANIEKLALELLEDDEIPFLFTPSQIGTACFLHLCSLDPLFPHAESFLETILSRDAVGYKLNIADVRPVLLDLRTRLTCFVEKKARETAEERAQHALKTIKQFERLSKLLYKVNRRQNKELKLQEEEAHTLHKEPPVQDLTAQEQSTTAADRSNDTRLTNAPCLPEMPSTPLSQPAPKRQRTMQDAESPPSFIPA